MNNEKMVVTEVDLSRHYRICWSSIIAGTLTGLGLGFLLHLYSIAIGLSIFSASTKGAEVIAIGGFIGMLIGVIASMGIAGFVSGYLGRHHYHSPRCGGVIYGFITWSLILFFTAISAGSLMSYTDVYKKSITHSAGVQVSNAADTPTIKQDKNTNAPTAEVSPTQLAWSGWIIFILFFIGAVSSCIGASWGMNCRRSDTCCV